MAGIGGRGEEKGKVKAISEGLLRELLYYAGA